VGLGAATAQAPAAVRGSTGWQLDRALRAGRHVLRGGATCTSAPAYPSPPA
jgi:hypothetical protein